MKKLFLLLLLAPCTLLPLQAQVSDYQNWMAGLDDNAFVCQLSIPGAHDACSSSFSGILSAIYKTTSQTQSKSVEAMLPLGTRLFDLRPCVSGNKLHINHGIATTSFDFDPIMNQLCNYVDAHPSEFCIVVIRHEVEGDDNNSSFGDKLQASLAAIKDHLVNFRPNLTVGEARGKILFISRDEYTAPIYGGRTVDLSDNRSNINDMLGGHCYGPGTNKCSWWLQDHYEISDNNVKKQVILDMLTRSSRLAGGYDYTWVVNQTSGYNGSTSSASGYQNNAKLCNKYMQELLASGNYNGPAGLVFMDYAVDGDNGGYYGLSLTKELINHNFRYTMSKQGDKIYDSSGNHYVAPRGREMMWEAKFLRKEGPSQPDGEDSNAASQLDAVKAPTGWYSMNFNDSGWETKRFPTASTGTGAPYYSQWDGTYNVLYIRREFNIEHDPSIDTYKFYVYHDDDYLVYLNGTKIDTQNGWSTDFNNYREVTINSSRLKVGRNVLAIQVQQNWGGAYFDCGVLRIEATSAPVKLTSNLWHGFIAPGYNIDFRNTDVQAYKIVQLVDGIVPYVQAEEVGIVPAGEAVIIRSDKGSGTYEIPVTKTSANLSGNLLKGTTASLSVTQPNTILTINTQKGKSAFYAVSNGTSLAKNKVYLDLSGTGINTNCLYINRDNPDGIDSLTPDPSLEKGEIYNLAGQRLQKMQRGINIVNGKKILR